MQIIKWHLAHGRHIELGETAQIMGILNVTPDSFSDGGQFTSHEKAFDQALKMIEEGASIIDIGGESTRPGAHAVTAATEQKRVLPVVKILAHEANCLISIDSYRAQTAKRAVEAGAHIINDVWGLQKDPAMADVAAETGAGLVIMHTGRGRQVKLPPIEDQLEFFEKSLRIAKRAGVRREAIVLDPGFGFGKETTAQNVELLAKFEQLSTLGYPFLVGTSRKRLLGAVTGQEPRDRDIATAATSTILRLKGAAIFRVHNVGVNRDALAVADALMRFQREPQTGNGTYAAASKTQGD